MDKEQGEKESLSAKQLNAIIGMLGVSNIDASNELVQQAYNETDVIDQPSD